MLPPIAVLHATVGTPTDGCCHDHPPQPSNSSAGHSIERPERPPPTRILSVAGLARSGGSRHLVVHRVDAPLPFS